MKIVTEFQSVPDATYSQPERAWIAYVEHGREHFFGYGRTEKEAVEELLKVLPPLKPVPPKSLQQRISEAILQEAEFCRTLELVMIPERAAIHQSLAGALERLAHGISKL